VIIWVQIVYFYNLAICDSLFIPQSLPEYRGSLFAWTSLPHKARCLPLPYFTFTCFHVTYSNSSHLQLLIILKHEIHGPFNLSVSRNPHCVAICFRSPPELTDMQLAVCPFLLEVVVLLKTMVCEPDNSSRICVMPPSKFGYSLPQL
jgi:hypothetical protein